MKTFLFHFKCEIWDIAILLILTFFFLWFPLLEEEDHFWLYDRINGNLKIGHSNSSFAIKYLGILLFFVLLILTFFLPFPLLESSVLLPEEDHFMPEPMVCSTAYNPYQYKQAPPTHVILNVVDIIIAKNILKTILDLDLPSIIFYSPLYTKVLICCTFKLCS